MKTIRGKVIRLTIVLLIFIGGCYGISHQKKNDLERLEKIKIQETISKTR